jgi:hypothetical protein
MRESLHRSFFVGADLLGDKTSKCIFAFHAEMSSCGPGAVWLVLEAEGLRDR